MTTAPENLRKRRLGFARKRQRTSASTLMGHLDELRSRLVICVLGFVAVSIAAFILFDPLTDVLLKPLCSLPPARLGPNGCRLIVTGPVEPVAVRLKVTAMAGMIASSPLWLYQIWAFVSPGLTRKEKKYAVPFVATSVTLFLIGLTIAYLTLPAALRFLVALGGDNFVPFLSAKEYLGFVSLVTIAFGATFELPLLLFFLGLVGVVTVEQLQKSRRHAIVAVAVIGAVITPSQDPFTMLALSLPLYIFYELVIAGLKMVRKRKMKAAA